MKTIDVIKMAEVSKQYKVVLYINMALCFIYGIIYSFFWWGWATIIEWEIGSTPWYGQVVGGVLLVLGIWFLRAVLQKKSWEDISYFMEFTFGFMIVMLLFEGWNFLFVRPTGIALINDIISTSVILFLFILNLIFYFMESAKHK